MLDVSSFLEKFKHLIETDRSMKDSVINSVFKVLSFKLAENNITVKGGTITIKANPVLKSEIFMKKELILEEIRTSSGNKNIKELKCY